MSTASVKRGYVDHMYKIATNDRRFKLHAQILNRATIDYLNYVSQILSSERALRSHEQDIGEGFDKTWENNLSEWG